MRIAVFGSLRSGLHNHHLLNGSKFIGECFTKEKFKMFSMGGFPGLRLNGEDSIKIEVYEINEDTAKDIDNLEGYPHFYNRKLTSTKFGDAWIYFNEKERYNGESIGSDWKTYFNEL